MARGERCFDALFPAPCRAPRIHCPELVLPRFLYTLLYCLTLPWIFLRLWLRARANPAYRQRWSERLAIYRNRPRLEHSVIFHAVSVGEVHAALPLIEQRDWKGDFRAGLPGPFFSLPMNAEIELGQPIRRSIEPKLFSANQDTLPGLQQVETAANREPLKFRNLQGFCRNIS